MLEPLNTEERKESIRRFLGLYIASVIVLGVVFLFCFSYFENEGSSNIPPYPAAIVPPPDEGSAVLAKDMDYLNGFSAKLARIDSLYNQAMVDSSPVFLGVMSDQLTTTEKDFKHAVDSITSKTAYQEGKVFQLLSFLHSQYNSMFKARQNLNLARQAILLSRADMSDDTKSVFKTQNDLALKNDRIAELEYALAGAKAKRLNGNDDDDIESLKKDKQALQQEVKTQNEMITNLSILNDKLKEENNQSTTSRDVTASSTDVSNTTITSLQYKVDELKADIDFAQIECNLKRVDANQIISNSRQRRELLTQSLQALTLLSKSTNVAVQNKAKTKIKELNTIAQNLRD